MGYRNNLFEVVQDSSVTTLLVDMDKTLTENGRAYPGVPEIMERIINSGVQVFVVSNSTFTSEGLLKNLAERNLEHQKHFTDTFSVGEVLRDFFASSALQNKKVLTVFNVLDKRIFPTKGNIEVLNIGFDANLLRRRLNEFNPDYIYIGTPYPDRASPLPLSEICQNFGEHIELLSSAGKPLLSGFKDTNFFENGRYITLQGDILKEIAKLNPAASIKTFGKPDTDIFTVLSRKYPEVKYHKESVMMVGDNPETDLIFARNLGIGYTHVLTSTGLSGKKANYIIPLVSGKENSASDYPALFNLLKDNTFCRS